MNVHLLYLIERRDEKKRFDHLIQDQTMGALAQANMLQRFENRQDDYSALAETHEECLETVWKLVTARQDLEHNATLYTIMSNHFK
ncbi:hypothetical protein Tco_0756325 [Tanacetum coccineum]